jgi:hypothetical protein
MCFITPGVNMSPTSSRSEANRLALSRFQPWMSRGLLTAWLLYSAAALGWFLANDPLLGLGACVTR